MIVCIKSPSTGHKTHVFCGREITGDDLVPVTIQHGVMESIRPDEFRDVCPKCREVIAKYLHGAG